ncbi:MAG TPA: rhomboid family intramembrane serine protease [Pelagibacterium sp.]|jgi:membrane associated rhomboid family serine protease|uniref:rhomboid family intramembrane serine protease n=1 Tax=uncultured Pelagibacterium sp. TaxID=1159875 RepID=UPI000C4C2349|nr:rhomboid family intramembrane serine protease [Pelagibacterium sp.]HCO56205.1 rhomboid family intramembrane serine protease [Pelagibacterium sp.]|tara:strand:+ start:237 stop:917 length:681 start_codon:yes stop_codon:yes gene_type:complete
MFLPLYDSNKIAHIERPFVNYGLIGVNIAVFLMQWAGGQDGLYFGQITYGMIPAVVSGAVEGPAPWLPDQATVFTYMFLHADWLHLLSNLLFLWVFGDNVEDAMGHWKYLVFYLACGVLSGLSHLWLFPDAMGPLIGASGAVAGIIGAYLVLYPKVRVFVLNRLIITFPLALPAWAVLGLWVATQLFYVFIWGDDGVAWWVHLGGVVAGAVLVLVFKRGEVALWGG